VCRGEVAREDLGYCIVGTPEVAAACPSFASGIPFNLKLGHRQAGRNLPSGSSSPRPRPTLSLATKTPSGCDAPLRCLRAAAIVGLQRLRSLRTPKWPAVCRQGLEKLSVGRSIPLVREPDESCESSPVHPGPRRRTPVSGRAPVPSDGWAPRTARSASPRGAERDRPAAPRSGSCPGQGPHARRPDRRASSAPPTGRHARRKAAPDGGDSDGVPLAGVPEATPAARPGEMQQPHSSSRRVATWLILPVVICLSQRLSHACLSTRLKTARLRMAH
jgi:hypothetical protein